VIQQDSTERPNTYTWQKKCLQSGLRELPDNIRVHTTA